MVPAREPVTIKLYDHRRLYRPATGRYVTIDDLTALANEGAEIAVHDAATGADITRLVVTQNPTEH
jgi:polyhydroxyalkanoate synthesis regulator protein